jgi:hypothetical protein
MGHVSGKLGHHGNVRLSTADILYTQFCVEYWGRAIITMALITAIVMSNSISVNPCFFMFKKGGPKTPFQIS